MDLKLFARKSDGRERPAPPLAENLRFSWGFAAPQQDREPPS